MTIVDSVNVEVEVAIKDGAYVKHVQFACADLIAKGVSVIDSSYLVRYFYSDNKEFICKSINKQTGAIKQIRHSRVSDILVFERFTLVYVGETIGDATEYYGYFDNNNEAYAMFPHLLSSKHKQYIDLNTSSIHPKWCKEGCIGISYKINNRSGSNGYSLFDITAFINCNIKDINTYFIG